MRASERACVRAHRGVQQHCVKDHLEPAYGKRKRPILLSKEQKPTQLAREQFQNGLLSFRRGISGLVAVEHMPNGRLEPNGNAQPLVIAIRQLPELPVPKNSSFIHVRVPGRLLAEQLGGGSHDCISASMLSHAAITRPKRALIRRVPGMHSCDM